MVQFSRASGEVDEDSFIHVPLLGIEVTGKKSYFGLEWDETHDALREEGYRMPTILEFAEFLKYTRVHFPEVYGDIIQSGLGLRGEWLDVYFEKRKDEFYILTGNKTNVEKLEGGLMNNRESKISLERDWLGNLTSQGLPNVKDKSLIATSIVDLIEDPILLEDPNSFVPYVGEGNLTYLDPQNGCPARFIVDLSSVTGCLEDGPGVGLYLGRYPPGIFTDIGVRAVKEAA